MGYERKINNGWEKKKKGDNKAVYLNPTILLVTLNVNDLNTPTKRQVCQTGPNYVLFRGK